MYNRFRRQGAPRASRSICASHLPGESIRRPLDPPSLSACVGKTAEAFLDAFGRETCAPVGHRSGKLRAFGKKSVAWMNLLHAKSSTGHENGWDASVAQIDTTGSACTLRSAIDT